MKVGKKTIALIEEASAKGAKLIAFPETFIPGYPWQIWLGAPAWAIGRGFGSGTFGLAQASTEMTDRPTASARLVASAVDRNAAARAERVTAFLCGGESFNR